MSIPPAISTAAAIRRRPIPRPVVGSVAALLVCAAVDGLADAAADAELVVPEPDVPERVVDDVPDPEPPCELVWLVVVEVGFASTTTVPCMNGWILQKYVIVPGCVNVCEPLAPRFRIPVSKLPLLAVAVCGLGPTFVQVIVSPTWIVTV